MMNLRKFALSVGLMGALLAVGCESSQPEKQVVAREPDRPQKNVVRNPRPTRSVPQAGPATSRSVDVRDEIVGRSVLGEPIRKISFGRGPRPMYIFAGIHGDEVASVELANNLIEDLLANPMDFDRYPVIVMPLINPDGFARNTRGNINGVDCNRNFPASNWRPLRGGRSGPKPLSEPEADVVYRTVEMHKPRAIISIHTIRGDRYCNNYDGPAASLAEMMSRYNGYPPEESIGYPTPGSFGSWAGKDLGYPVITLELPRGIDEDSAWARNREALRSAIQYQGVGR